MTITHFDVRKLVNFLESTKKKDRYICPVCGNHNLTINMTSGAYTCWNGCESKEVTKELKKIWREKYGEIESPQEKRVRERGKTEYYYNDRNGRNLVRVVKVVPGYGEEKKSIYQQHWGGDSWEKGYGPIKTPDIPLYRYQEVMEAIDRGEPIILCEGESVADAFWKRGLPATTTVGGTGKTVKKDKKKRVLRNDNAFNSIKPALEDLKKAEVILAPDRDQPGCLHMEMMAEILNVKGWLYAFPKSPQYWQDPVPKEGLDFVDWIRDYPSLTKTEILDAVVPEPIHSLNPAKNEEGEELEQGGLEEEGEQTLPLVCALEKAEKAIGERIRFNELTNEIELDQKPLNMDRIKLELEKNFKLHFKKVSERDLIAIIGELADRNAYNPVKDYLEGCVKKHQETKILDNLAERYLGCSEKIYQVYLKKFLIGAVARAFNPGCKMETALILQSLTQGWNKSTFLEVLAGKDFFCDDMGDANSKDERLKLHMAWIHEWGEIEYAISRKETGQLKAFLSCKEDLIRPPYGRTVRRMKRRCIIAGTTNDSGFLRDPTGDRRYWVCPTRKKIPIEQLKEERDKIWGAAVAAFKNGEKWWLDDQEQQLSSIENENYRQGSVFDEQLESFLIGKQEVATKDILSWMGVSLLNNVEVNKAQKDIKFSMQRLHWETSRVRQGEKQLRGYKKVCDTSPRAVTECDRYVSQGQSHTESAFQNSVTGVTGNSNKTFQNDREKEKKGIDPSVENTNTEAEEAPLQTSLFAPRKADSPTRADVAEKLRGLFFAGSSSISRIKEKDFARDFIEKEIVAYRLEEMEKDDQVVRHKGFIYLSSLLKFGIGTKVEILQSGAYKGKTGIVKGIEEADQFLIKMEDDRLLSFSSSNLTEMIEGRVELNEQAFCTPDHRFLYIGFKTRRMMKEWLNHYLFSRIDTHCSEYGEISSKYKYSLKIEVIERSHRQQWVIKQGVFDFSKTPKENRELLRKKS